MEPEKKSRSGFLPVILVVVVAFVAVIGWIRPIPPGISFSPGGPGLPIPVEKLPEETETGFQPVDDYAWFDLRAWVDPKDRSATRHSPVYFTEFMLLKKVDKGDTFVFHMETGGSKIDISCLTQPVKVYLRTGKTIHGQEAAGRSSTPKEYAVEVDTSKIAVGSSFLVLVDAVYWDSFTNPQSEDVSNYTIRLPESHDLVLGAVLPDAKPARSVTAQMIASDKEGKLPNAADWPIYPEKDDVKLDPHGQFVRWNIAKREPDTHYRLSWTW